MFLIVKISCSLFVFTMIQYTNSFPQFSIPSVSWSKNREEPSKLTLNVRLQIGLSSSYGIHFNTKQHEKTQRNNEKIITVTPNAGYYLNNYDKLYTMSKTTEKPIVLEIYAKPDQVVKSLEDKPTVQCMNKIKENENKQEYKLNLKDGYVNSIFSDYDTTESTTEYETTTLEDSSDLYRGGVSGHVVATLLG